MQKEISPDCVEIENDESPEPVEYSEEETSQQ